MSLLVGTAPNQVPANADLGDMAYMNRDQVVLKPPTSVTPQNIGEVVLEFTNNTTLTLKGRGTDGVVRSITLTLA